MKTTIASIFGIVLVVFLVTAGIRWFSAATTSISIVTPKPGVECALASTSDGASISCWKVQ